MAASKTIGGINVTISATTEKFSKGVAKARKELTGLQKSIAGVQLGLKSFVAGMAGAATLGAMTKFTHAGIEQVGALSDLSVKLGISTEKLAAYQIAAEDSSVSQATFEKSVLKMTKGINDATLGVGSAAKAYARLGIDVDALNKLAPDEQFLAIADAIKDLDGQNEKLNATMAIFGTKGSDMIRFLELGREGMAKYQEQAKAMGLSIKDDVAASVEAAGDALARFNRILEGLKVKAAVGATPLINALDEALTGAELNKGDGTKYVAQMSNRLANMSINPVGWAAGMFGDVARNMDWGAMGTPGRVPRLNGSAFDKSNPLSTTGLFTGHGDGSPLPRSGRAKEDADAYKKLGDSLGDLAKQGLDFARTLPGKRFGGNRLGDIANAPWMLPSLLQGGLAGLDGWESLAAKKSGRRSLRQSLSADDPLSREGFGQRVRSVAQNDMKNLGKQQLNQQTLTRVAVEKLAANSAPRAAARI